MNSSREIASCCCGVRKGLATLDDYLLRHEFHIPKLWSQKDHSPMVVMTHAACRVTASDYSRRSRGIYQLPVVPRKLSNALNQNLRDMKNSYMPTSSEPGCSYKIEFYSDKDFYGWYFGPHSAWNGIFTQVMLGWSLDRVVLFLKAYRYRCCESPNLLFRCLTNVAVSIRFWFHLCRSKEQSVWTMFLS